MTAINNVLALVQKEWRHYFGSPIAYVGLFVWTLLFGLFFSVRLYYFLQMSQAGPRYGGGTSLNEFLITPVLYNMAVVTLFLTPMMTMRLFAEEKRQGTMELLATAPLTDLQIVVGKFLGALALYAVMIAVGFLNLGILWLRATNAPDWRPLITGTLALLLLGGSFIALGLLVSTFTRNQIVAGTLTFGLILGIWIIGWVDPTWFGGAWQPVVEAITYLGLMRHFEDLMKGILDLKDVVFYLSFTLFNLFLAHQSVESQRWRA